MTTVNKIDPYNIGNGATFSSCAKYRYSLWRTFCFGPRRCVFIMLNPSTADHLTNDRSVAKCEKYARKWGYDSMAVLNLFAWRATDPRKMKKVALPVGPENDAQILEACKDAALVVAAWSNHGRHLNRSLCVRTLLRRAGIKLHALHVNITSEPAHPLYLPYSLKPKVFKL